MRKEISRATEKTGSELDRRDFMMRVGGGIVVFFAAGSAAVAQQGPPAGRGGGVGFGPPGGAADLNAYLKIGEDGKVTVFSGKIEQGQGNMTALAQMAADELGVALESINMIMGDTELCPWDMGTFGSSRRLSAERSAAKPISPRPSKRQSFPKSPASLCRCASIDRKSSSTTITGRHRS
jgi:CO/xanthine dehydrogenase Mo-binding subunit